MFFRPREAVSKDCRCATNGSLNVWVGSVYAASSAAVLEASIPPLHVLMCRGALAASRVDAAALPLALLVLWAADLSPNLIRHPSPLQALCALQPMLPDRHRIILLRQPSIV